jgi:hypothetical protein
LGYCRSIFNVHNTDKKIPATFEQAFILFEIVGIIPYKNFKRKGMPNIMKFSKC